MVGRDTKTEIFDHFAELRALGEIEEVQALEKRLEGAGGSKRLGCSLYACELVAVSAGDLGRLPSAICDPSGHARDTRYIGHVRESGTSV